MHLSTFNTWQESFMQLMRTSSVPATCFYLRRPNLILSKRYFAVRYNASCSGRRGSPGSHGTLSWGRRKILCFVGGWNGMLRHYQYPDYIASNGKTTDERWIENLEWSSLRLTEVLLSAFPWWGEENCENLSRDGQCPGRYLNRISSNTSLERSTVHSHWWPIS